MARKKQKFQTIFYLIIALILCAVAGTYIFLTNNGNPTTGQNSVAPIAITSEAEVMAELTATIDEKLSDKNNWDTADFSTYVTYNNRFYTIVRVVPQTSDIPEGLVLAKQNGETLDIVFDTTTPDPCSTLVDGEAYPPPIVDMCAGEQ